MGTRAAQAWGGPAHNAPYARGGPQQMGVYVNHFLSAIRNDFPNISIDDIGSADVIAAADRTVNAWNGDVHHYWPKGAVIITFNHCVSFDHMLHCLCNSCHLQLIAFLIASS
jgi:hypothetical protein